MTSEAGGEPARGLGARLRAARESKGLTVLQAAEKLHVDGRTVEALEGEDFAALGADVYVRGHLRRYAEAVGESPTELQALYAGKPHAERPDLTRIPRSDPTSRSTPLMLPALLVVGLALAGVLWWLITLQGEKAHSVAAVAPTLPVDTGTAPGASAASGVPAAPTSAGPAPSASTGNAVVAARAAPADVPAGSAGQAQLSLKFSASSWVAISDAAGRRLLQGLMQSGSTRTLAGEAPLRVVLGNATAVALRLNGQPVVFEGLVHRDGSAHLSIDAAGRVTAAGPRLAHWD